MRVFRFSIYGALALGLMAAGAAHGQGFVVSGRGGAMTLSGPSCDAVRAQLKSFQKWSENEGQAAACGAPTATPDGCVAKIGSCVPERVREIQGLAPLADGPDCFNTALYSAGVLPYLGASNAQEAEVYFSAPLCTRRTGEARPGDVGLIMKNDGTFVHAFINISDQLIFSKNGGDIRASYLIQAKTPVVSGYEKFACGNSPNCSTHTEYYSCQPLNAYLGQHPDSPEFDKLKSQVDNLDRRMHAYDFDRNANNAGNLKGIAHDLNGLETDIAWTGVSTVAEYGRGRSFTFGRLASRVLSLSRQVEGLNQVSASTTDFSTEAASIPLTYEDRSVSLEVRTAIRILQTGSAAAPNIIHFDSNWQNNIPQYDPSG